MLSDSMREDQLLGGVPDDCIYEIGIFIILVDFVQTEKDLLELQVVIFDEVLIYIGQDVRLDLED